MTNWKWPRVRLWTCFTAIWFLAAQGLDTVTLDALFRSAVLTTIQLDVILHTSAGRFMVVEIFTDQALDMSVETDQALEMECETW